MLAAPAQLPITNSVPPRVISRLPFAFDVKVAPRKPVSTDPGPIGGPLLTKELSLLTATLMVIVLFVVSMKKQSALPLFV
jgi:hypothetical protein